MKSPSKTIDGIADLGKGTQSAPLGQQDPAHLLDTASGGKALRSLANVSENGTPQYGHPSYLDENLRQFLEDMVKKWNEAGPEAVTSKDLMFPLVKLNSGTSMFNIFYQESDPTLRHRLDQLCKGKTEFERTKKGKWSYIGWTVLANNKVVFE